MLRVSDQLLKIPGILLALAFGYLLLSLGRQTEDVPEDDPGYGDDDFVWRTPREDEDEVVRGDVWR